MKVEVKHFEPNCVVHRCDCGESGCQVKRWVCCVQGQGQLGFNWKNKQTKKQQVFATLVHVWLFLICEDNGGGVPCLLFFDSNEKGGSM